MDKKIYLDNAATTALSKEVIDEILPFIYEEYANPSSNYTLSEKSVEGINNARKIISDYLGANKNDIYFTSGGSESDNWAIKGIAFGNRHNGNHIITSKIEHPAVLNTCKYLETIGFEVTYINVDENGIINLEELKNSITPKTILISIMYANNEIGTIQPIKEIGKIAKERKVLFHCDAVQAYGSLEINVDELNLDALSASAHKINGPKGVGLLYLRNGVKIHSLIHGGMQERNKRAGTYNVPGIIGFGKATEIAIRDMERRNEYKKILTNHFKSRIFEEFHNVRLNGHEKERLSNNINISFKGIEGESIKILLDKVHVFISTGSACTSTSKNPSHVLKAISVPEEYIGGSIRISLSDETIIEEIDFVIDELKRICHLLRKK